MVRNGSQACGINYSCYGQQRDKAEDAFENLQPKTHKMNEFLHGMQTIENCCLNAVANLSLDGRKRFVGCRYRHNGRVNFPAQRIKPTVD